MSEINESDLPLWRVELAEDGAVRSCEPVAEPATDGRYVRYVRAASSAGAIKTAKIVWSGLAKAQAKQARIADTRKRLGLCTICGCRALRGKNPATGKPFLTCQNCADYQRMRVLAKQGKPFTPAALPTPKGTASRVAEELGMSRASLNQRLVFLRKAASMYDENPASFRERLSIEIAKLTGKKP